MNHNKEIVMEQKKQGIEHRLLGFSIASETYGIYLDHIKEVIGITNITSVPFTPSFFKGVINLRGMVISVIDLGERFSSKDSKRGSESAIIIIDLEGESFGVIVDQVDQVFAIKETNIKPPPTSDVSNQSKFINGVAQWDEKVVILLNLENTLTLTE